MLNKLKKYSVLIVRYWFLIFVFTVILSPVVLLIAKLVSNYLFNIELDFFVELLSSIAINCWILGLSNMLSKKNLSYIMYYICALILVSIIDYGLSILSIVISLNFMLIGFIAVANRNNYASEL